MPTKEFFEELKIQLEREYDLKSKLDGKANTIIAITGTVASLLAGFGGILISKMNPTYEFINYILLDFILGLIIIVATLILALIAHLSRNYWYPIGHEQFFISDKEEPNKEKIKKFLDADDEKFYKHMINEYLYCIKKIVNLLKLKVNSFRLVI